MSHFAVAVFTKDGGKTVEELLAPYDENVDMPRYVKYTKAQLIEKGRKEIEDYKNGLYAEYLPNPEKYRAECKNPNHLNYIENEFPKKLTWTDEQIYAEEITSYDDDEIGTDGEVYSAYNPKSKWDWWTDGGRYGGLLLIKSPVTKGYPEAWNCSGREPIEGYSWVNSARFKDIQWELMAQRQKEDYARYWDEAQGKDDFIKKIQYGIEPGMTKDEYVNQSYRFLTFAVVTPDGEWYEKGKMGWWAVISNEEAAWDDKYKECFLDKANPVWALTIVDCHI